MKEVDPIRSMEEIEKVKKYLKENEIPRNYLLFTFGINSALRTSDMLRLKVSDVTREDFSIADTLYLNESKTGKAKKYHLSNSAKEAINYYVDKEDPEREDWLFPSQKGGHINRSWAWELVKGWSNKLNLTGNISAYSLRKTFGYMARTEFDVPISKLMMKFNHSTSQMTKRYIGIEEDEIAEVEKKVSL